MVAAACRRAAAASPSTDTAMLCCGRKKDGQHEQTTEMAASPRRQGADPGPQAPPMGPSTSSTTPVAMRQKDFPPMVVQSDFRKVSGISTEIFRQIETVENDHDATTAAALEAVERRGEMLVRILDPRHMGKAASEAARAFLTVQDPKHVVHFVEIVKRPGQTLGLYIREGNGIDRSDGVFISRIALESPVYNSGCLRVGDEILAVNLVDVTRMSLDDVVIIMSIPRRLVLTTRQRRGPPGAMSPPPPRPEHKPPPVVVLKRGLDEEPMDDTTSTSNSNGDRAYQQMGPSARLLASGRPLPGMADLPVHGTFPRNGERSDRDRFREREAGRYPERSAMNEEPRYFDQSLGLGRSQYEDQFKSPAQRFKSATLDRSGGYDLGMDLSQVATYQPPPPPSVVTEQPKPGAPQHFHPFERSYPKTLESLAERVHPFYGLQGPGALNLVMSQQGQGQAIGRASTLGRVRMPPNVASGVSQQMRGGRLLRSGSDQRLPVVEGTSEFYEYIMSRAGQTRSSLKPGTMQHYPVGRQGSADSARVPAPRRRTSVDYASDTEASTRQQRSAFPRRPVPGYAVEESWRPPATLGIGVTPTTSTMSFTSQEASSRSNSLPRDRGGRYRRGVRFEKELGGSGTQQDSQDDSDGAISAPEMSSTQQQQQQQQLQKSILDLQQPASFHGRLPDTPSVFTSAEYKAWLQRTPSTSAIYERLRQGRDASEAQKAAKFTFSAENLMDKTRQEPPYYSYRSHFSALQQDDNLLTGLAGGGRPPLRTAEEPRGIPQPTPGRTAAEPRFKLIDINPAEFIKYRSERPNGATPTSNQPGNTNTVGVSPATPGPGPAPGGTEEGVSGLLWVHLLAGRSLRSTSSRAEPVRDLYCVLESDRVHKARTVIRNGDVNFDWDETFDLDLVVNKELDFLIYSWDPQLRHRLCFKGSLHLIPLLRESPVHQIALKVEPRGTLYLKLRYTEPRAAFRRTPAARKTPPPLFGIDIETVVNREGSGLGVPVIIQKCVEEVERRGMDIVGLYRLCGSATKKRILREAFERNPRLVDLSPDSVPDINVITGLLKEYLRELPEPLFTKCLYQMLVDALAVCLPDDPEGNAKLMFSILECLPKSSRTTLFLLMDHLCLVAAQSDRNKMTPQNLAICFGPVLMLHSDDVTSLDFQKPIGVLKYLVQIWPMKSARAAEAAATASLTLRRLQGPPPSQQQQVTPTSAAVAVSSNPQQVTAGPEVPPLPPRPAPRTLQPRAGQTKAQHALGVYTAAGDVIAARGEADGSPAPMAEFLAALDSAAANSEDATPASSVTPSLTSPTSTSTSTTTTSASPLQPLVRGIAEGQRSRDCSDHSAGSKKSGGAGNGSSVRKDLTRGAINTEEDTEQEADSDLDSPN